VAVFLAAFLIMGLQSFGQQSRPVITFTEKEYGFGTIRESDGVVNHNFSFVNNGKVPLIINDVKTSCGCASPQWPKEPVLPGATGSISVRFDPKARPGAFSKTIQVISNADVPSVTLVINGVVIPAEKVEEAFRFTIGTVRFETIYAAFGELYKGSTGKFTIKVFNMSNSNPVTLSFRNVPAHLRVTMVPLVVDPQQEGSIDIEYLTNHQKEWDYAVDRLELLINGQSLPNNRISITANIRENFSGYTAEKMAVAPHVEFDNTSFDFGTIADDKVVEHAFKLVNSGKSDLFIRKVSASCGCTAVQPDKTVVPPGESTVIRAVFNASGREGHQKKAITVITNDPKRSKTILWINAMVEKKETASQTNQ
jgi:hypothetical protein